MRDSLTPIRQFQLIRLIHQILSSDLRFILLLATRSKPDFSLPLLSRSLFHRRFRGFSHVPASLGRYAAPIPRCLAHRDSICMGTFPPCQGLLCPNALPKPPTGTRTPYPDAYQNTVPPIPIVVFLIARCHLRLSHVPLLLNLPYIMLVSQHDRPSYDGHGLGT